MKLTEQDINNWKDAQQFEQKIIDRIDYIIKTIYKTFEHRLSYWYFYGAGEGEVGNIPSHELKPGGYISVICDSHKDSMVYLEHEGDIELVGDGFPSRWLYEDFEDELKLGRENYIKRIEDAKRRKEEAKQKKKDAEAEEAKEKVGAIKALMSKLSPEERKLLKKINR